MLSNVPDSIINFFVAVLFSSVYFLASHVLMQLPRLKIRRLNTKGQDTMIQPMRELEKYEYHVKGQSIDLLDLPDELIVLVLSNLDTDGLSRARSVSKQLRNLSEPFVFEHFAINKGRHATALTHLMDQDRYRSRYVRSLLVSTPLGNEDSLTEIPNELSFMNNLKELRLETPDCNQKSPEDRRGWIALQRAYESLLARATVAVPAKDRVLSKLETVTMHFVDEVTSLYSLTKYSSVFLHPTLKSLTLSCACTDFHDQLLVPYQKDYRRSTALEYLHLEECDINAQTLSMLLRFPRALKSLKISEAIRYDEPFGNATSRIHGNTAPHHLSDALARSCGHSLETLSLALGHNRRTFGLNRIERGLDLTRMGALRTLEVSMATLMLLIDRPCQHSTHKRLPQGLETLHVFGIPFMVPHIDAIQRRPAMPFQSCVYQQKAAHGLPNLHTTIWTYEHQAPGGGGLYGYYRRQAGEEVIARQIQLNKDYLVDHCNKEIVQFRSAGVRVKVQVEVTPAGYIPPYLCTEKKPIVSLLWDSSNPPLEGQAQLNQVQGGTQRNLTKMAEHVRTHSNGSEGLYSSHSSNSSGGGSGSEGSDYEASDQSDSTGYASGQSMDSGSDDDNGNDLNPYSAQVQNFLSQFMPHPNHPEQ